MPNAFNAPTNYGNMVGNDCLSIFTMLINKCQTLMLPLSGPLLFELYKNIGYRNRLSPAQGMEGLLCTTTNLFAHDGEVPWRDMPVTHFLYFLGAVVSFQSSWLHWLVSLTSVRLSSL